MNKTQHTTHSLKNMDTELAKALRKVTRAVIKKTASYLNVSMHIEEENGFHFGVIQWEKQPVFKTVDSIGTAKIKGKELFFGPVGELNFQPLYLDLTRVIPTAAPARASF